MADLQGLHAQARKLILALRAGLERVAVLARGEPRGRGGVQKIRSEQMGRHR